MSRAAASSAALQLAPQPPSQGACPVCGDAAAEASSPAAPSDAAGGGGGGGVGGACSSAAGDGAGSGAGASDGASCASCDAPAAGSYGAGGAGGGDGGSASAASMRSCSARVTAARASLCPPHGAAPRDAAASVRLSCAPLLLSAHAHTTRITITRLRCVVECADCAVALCRKERSERGERSAKAPRRLPVLRVVGADGQADLGVHLEAPVGLRAAAARGSAARRVAPFRRRVVAPRARTVRKAKVGGLKGYSGGSTMRPWKRPPCVAARREARYRETRRRGSRASRSLRRRGATRLELSVAWAAHDEVPLEDVVLRRPGRARGREHSAQSVRVSARAGASLRCAGRRARASSGSHTKSRLCSALSSLYSCTRRHESAPRAGEETKRSLLCNRRARKTQRDARSTRACSSRFTAGFLAFARAKASIEASTQTHTWAYAERVQTAHRQNAPAKRPGRRDGTGRRCCTAGGARLRVLGALRPSQPFLAIFAALRSLNRALCAAGKEPVQRSVARCRSTACVVSCSCAVPASGRPACERAAAQHAC